MEVIIGCEESQAVTNEFRKQGFEAWSCDLQNCSGGHPEYHHIGDIIKLLESTDLNKLKFLGLHPVCQFLANSGVRWLTSRKPKKGYTWSEKYQIYMNWDRYEQMKKAALFFKLCLMYLKKTGRGYIENPIMHKYAKEIIGVEPTQIIQPYEYGHMEKKATCLWIEGLPNLEPTNNVYDEMMKLTYAERSKVHYCSPGPERNKLRSKTYSGIAKAMAEQWGKHL